MKTVQELRQALKDAFDRATENQELDAVDRVPLDMDAETLAVYEKVARDLFELTQKSLKKDVLYCVPDDDFYPAIERLMKYELYALYTTYEIAPDVTDEQILAHSDAIERGDLVALAPLRKDPPDTRFQVAMAEGYQKRRQMFNNLSYYFYVMAHLAKHYGSREAAQNYLRAASIARKGYRRLPLNLTDATIDELLSLAQEAVDALKVAADYFALSDWESFRTAEEAKFAAATADAKPEEAGTK